MNRKTRAGTIVRMLTKNPLAMIGLAVIILLFIMAIFAPVIIPYPYDYQDYSAVLQGSSPEHWFGTDELGRDILSRIIYGSRISLSMGMLAVLISLVFGIVFGAIAGYYGGIVDNIFMRFFDIYQSMPQLILAIVLASLMGASVKSCIIALGLAGIPRYARLVRASVMQIRDSEYIDAARTIGAGNFWIVMKHVLPNSLSPIIVMTTMNLGSYIIQAAGLSFIGLGAQPPLPEWGAMLSNGRSMMRDHSNLVMVPGAMIMITVISYNLFGDGLRDALDPRQY